MTGRARYQRVQHCCQQSLRRETNVFSNSAGCSDRTYNLLRTSLLQCTQTEREMELPIEVWIAQAWSALPAKYDKTRRLDNDFSGSLEYRWTILTTI